MKFWEWFEENDEQIREVLANGNREQKAELTEQLDEFILDLGRFSWEIIKDSGESFTFVISPNRDQDLFLHSQRIILEAPLLAHWTFLPAKAADKAMVNFEIYDEAVNLRTFQPKLWKVKAESSIGLYNVTIGSTDFNNCDLDTCLFACEMALSSFLGEEVYINKIGKIKISQDMNDMIAFGDLAL
jgi:hypothetical protein